MPKTSYEILSTVQNSINDVAGERIQQGEYIDYFNEIVNDVSKETEIYLARYITTPNIGVPIWINNRSFERNTFVEHEGNYYMSEDSTVINKDPSDLANHLYWTQIFEWDNTTSYFTASRVYINNPPQFFQSKQNNNINQPPGTFDNPAWQPLVIGQPYQVTIPYIDPSNNQVLSPYRILRVARTDTPRIQTIGQDTEVKWRETREYSVQAVSATGVGNTAFNVNTVDISRHGFAPTFIDKDTGTVTDARTLTFARPFEIGEQVVIDFIQTQPFSMEKWYNYTPSGNLLWVDNYPPVEIPDFLLRPYRWGLQWLVCENLYTKGDDGFAEKANRAKMYYDMFLREAMGYAHMLLDKNSSLQSQPIIWLPE